MFADQLLDYFSVRHLWEQLVPLAKTVFLDASVDEATEAEIDAIFSVGGDA